MTVKYLGETCAPFLLTKGVRPLPALKDYPDRDYGVAFEAPAYLLEQLLNLQQSRDVFMFRHLLGYLVFLAGVYAMYRLAERRFGDWRLGLFAASLLVLSPRFFAESFYNSKDLVFTAAFVIGLTTMIGFLTKPSVKTALLHALATAFAVDVRIVGIGLLIGTVALVFLLIVRKEWPAVKPSRPLLLYIAVTCALIVIMWPWLWSNPLGHLVLALKHMSSFPWLGSVRYLGHVVSATHLPWHYLFVWIGVTTPLFYLGLALIGLAAVLRQMISRRAKLWSGPEELQDLVFLAVFLAPIFAALLLHSVLYDGWRHLYFVYPALLLIAVRGWVVLWRARESRTLKVALGLVTFLLVGHTAFWMCQVHPMQNVYFNPLAGRKLRARFELDYWGLGNRQALEYILAHDPSPQISVQAGSATPVLMSQLLLTPEERSRLVVVDTNAAIPHYVLTNYRCITDVDDVSYRAVRLVLPIESRR